MREIVELHLLFCWLEFLSVCQMVGGVVLTLDSAFILTQVLIG